MTIRNERTLEHFEFFTLAELRDWLNMFHETDLSTINIETHNINYVCLSWREETLSDGSKVISAFFS